MTTLAERWAPVLGWEGVYEASTMGRIKRIARARGATPGSVTTGYHERNGYVKVSLYKDGIEFRTWLHRIIAMAFLGPIPEGHEVNHKDSDPSNDTIDNLEYVTHRQNLIHAVDRGRTLTGERCYNAVLTEDGVRFIWEQRMIGASVPTIAKHMGVHQNTIYSVTQGKSWRRVSARYNQIGNGLTADQIADSVPNREVA